MRFRIVCGNAFFALCLAVSLAQPVLAQSGWQRKPEPVYQPSKSWSVIFNPSFGFPSASGDATFGPVENADVDVTLADTIGNIRPWFNINFETMYKPSRLGLALTFSYVSIENAINGSSEFFSFDTDLKRRQGEAVAFFRFFDGESTGDLYGGVRMTQFNINSSGQDPTGTFALDEDFDLVDPIVGLRISPRINDQWSLRLQGDSAVGGDSESDVSAIIGVVWEQSEDLSLSLLYRADWVDFVDKGVELDTVVHGPLFGLQFEFGR